MKNYLKIPAAISLLIIAIVVLCGQANAENYEPDWDSLKNHPTPDWFRDAKFGIYTHWGAYTVPQFGNEWYARWMYHDEKVWGKHYHNHHKKTYGDPSKFGYKDFIPMFTAKKFDADEWAEIFKRAGAQFAGPVAEHHDGFSMWDSALTKWDAVEMGPKRDIVGELEKSIKKQGMKFMTSFHHARKWWYYEVSYTPEKKYDTEDPAYSGLYPEPHEVYAPPTKAYMEEWKGKILEVVDTYRPDLIWFDGGLDKERLWRESREDFQQYKKEMLAHYYNKEKEWGSGVVMTYKHHDIPEGAAVLDIERGRLDKLVEFPWLTDTTISRTSWCYIDGETYKTPNELVDVLVDIVSKNGCMLLNVGPKADGSIPEEAKQLLFDIGDWLEVNGEAIYGTRPWKVFGEGPTLVKAGPMSEGPGEEIFTSRDYRFTSSGKTVYAIGLDWPESGEMMITSLGRDVSPELNIKSVELLGYKGKLKWKQFADNLSVMMPKTRTGKHAYVLKVRTK